MSSKSDIDRAWDLAGDVHWDRAEVAAIMLRSWRKTGA